MCPLYLYLLDFATLFLSGNLYILRVLNVSVHFYDSLRENIVSGINKYACPNLPPSSLPNNNRKEYKTTETN
jgi:hypothetical protein